MIESSRSKPIKRIEFFFSDDGTGEAVQVGDGCWDVTTPHGGFKHPFTLAELRKKLREKAKDLGQTITFEKVETY